MEFNLFNYIKYLTTNRKGRMKVKIINRSKHDLPQYETKASAGVDLRANISEPFTLQSLERNLVRSEEHTSELQSRPHLVCRLLLEKKKTAYETATNGSMTCRR